MINDFNSNKDAGTRIGQIAQWHHDRNLIDGATTQAQTVKLLEEFVELVAAQLPGKSHTDIYFHVKRMLLDLHENGRIKPVAPENTSEALQDAIGDMAVVAINIAEREGFTYDEALAGAYDEIKDRKGKMIDGIFVKEADLIDEK
jgi:hypothetical protein